MAISRSLFYVAIIAFPIVAGAFVTTSYIASQSFETDVENFEREKQEVLAFYKRECTFQTSVGGRTSALCADALATIHGPSPEDQARMLYARRVWLCDDTDACQRRAAWLFDSLQSLLSIVRWTLIVGFAAWLFGVLRWTKGGGSGDAAKMLRLSVLPVTHQDALPRPLSAEYGSVATGKKID